MFVSDRTVFSAWSSAIKLLTSCGASVQSSPNWTTAWTIWIVRLYANNAGSDSKCISHGVLSSNVLLFRRISCCWQCSVDNRKHQDIQNSPFDYYVLYAFSLARDLRWGRAARGPRRLGTYAHMHTCTLLLYKEVKEIRKEQQQWHQSRENQMILSWLTEIDYGSQQSDILNRRQDGTGQWILETDEFQLWVSDKNRTLFCPGIPGAGKTILTSIVIDYLQQTLGNSGSVGIAYLYCNFRQGQTLSNLLLSLLKQLLQGRPSLPESVKCLYEDHIRRGSRPGVDEIMRVLQSVSTDYERTFMIVDALDQCSVSDGTRQRFLEEIFSLQKKTGLSLLATSGRIEEIEKQFKDSAFLEIQAHYKNIQSYLDSEMLRLPSFISRNLNLQKEIKLSISKAVKGM